MCVLAFSVLVVFILTRPTFFFIDSFPLLGRVRLSLYTVEPPSPIGTVPKYVMD